MSSMMIQDQRQQWCDYYYNMWSSLKITSGKRFQPSDSEIISKFLRYKIATEKGVVGVVVLSHEEAEAIREVNLYAEQPWVLWQNFCSQSTSSYFDHDHDLYFYTHLKRKKLTSSLRFDRCIGKGKGSWHGEDSGTRFQLVQKKNMNKNKKQNPSEETTVDHIMTAVKKRFSYRNPTNAEEDRRWIMHEYSCPDRSDWVVCRLRKNPERGLHMTKRTFPCLHAATTTTTSYCDIDHSMAKRPKLLAASENSSITTQQLQMAISEEVHHHYHHLDDGVHGLTAAEPTEEVVDVTDYGLSGIYSNTYSASGGQQLQTVSWTAASSSGSEGRQYGGNGSDTNSSCASHDYCAAEQSQMVPRGGNEYCDGQSITAEGFDEGFVVYDDTWAGLECEFFAAQSGGHDDVHEYADSGISLSDYGIN